MSITVLVTEADEKSTYVVTCGFADAAGADVIPNWIKWTFVDLSESVINGREQEVVTVPAASISVTLSGDDLQILSAEAARKTVKRRFIVEAEYDSDEGSNLPLKGSCEITIRNHKYIS